jgi:GNAT superfamily N-acetyltransferase
MATPIITIKSLTWTHPDATTLREAQQQEIDGSRPIGPGVWATATNVPIFLLAYEGDEPIGCGGLRPLADQGLPGQAEVKRMYVVPSRRRSSKDGAPTVALLLLEALEQAARDNGWITLKVETSKGMAQARRFYEKHSYVPCAVFGGYQGSDHSVCYEKHLA